ncbi:MAG: tyrosine-protein phosphatase [Devosia sp.]
MLLLLPPIGAGAWAIIVQFNGNVHEVVPGELYRSAQLNGARLKGVIDQFAIRSIINLRGGEPNNDFYSDELNVSSASGVVHFDVPMSAGDEPSPATLEQLIGLLRTAPRPLLVHCKDGSDRTGLASALFELLVLHRPASEASGQLSFAYGHFPWLGSPTIAMDNTFDRIVAAGI